MSAAGEQLQAPSGGQRVAFVMEQALGHITHAKNLQGALADHPGIEARWSMVEFGTAGLAARLPIYRSNWTVRAGLRARRQLRQLARGSALDAVYFHTQVPAVFSRRWLRRLPSVVSMDATPRQYDELGAAYGHRSGPAWLERVKWRLNRDCFREADRVVAFSAWAKQGLVEDYEVPAEKVSVISPGVDLRTWAYEDRSARSEQAPLKVLFVGGDFRRKGGPLLLQAFTAVRDLGVELHVVTKHDVDAGPGCVVHTGVQANSAELVALFRQADVFCLPTDGDTLGIVFAEAGATGLPCIATSVGAIPEVVRDGETGILVEPGDLDGLVAALRLLLGSPELRLRYGRAAREHVVQHLDAEVNSARVVALCQDVMAQAAGDRPRR